jgi:hypothetical protein
LVTSSLLNVNECDKNKKPLTSSHLWCEKALRLWDIYNWNDILWMMARARGSFFTVPEIQMMKVSASFAFVEREKHFTLVWK